MRYERRKAFWERVTAEGRLGEALARSAVLENGNEPGSRCGRAAYRLLVSEFQPVDGEVSYPRLSGKEEGGARDRGKKAKMRLDWRWEFERAMVWAFRNGGDRNAKASNPMQEAMLGFYRDDKHGDFIKMLDRILPRLGPEEEGQEKKADETKTVVVEADPEEVMKRVEALWKKPEVDGG